MLESIDMSPDNLRQYTCKINCPKTPCLIENKSPVKIYEPL